MGGYQYKNGELQFFPTAEGYVRNTQGALSYVFQYRDHLGNIRLSYAENPAAPGTASMIEENHYYPFGLKHANYNSDQMEFAKQEQGLVLKEKPGDCVLCPPKPTPLWNNYKYNGKEFQDELGLNLYDYGARNYDPAIGRWMNIDPLIELMRDNSTYSYAFNNPIYFIDSDGMIPLPQIVKFHRTSSEFGLRFHPLKKKMIGHAGIDLAASTGSEVKSAAIGTIAKIGWDPDGYGNYIIVEHINGYYTLYGHLDKIGKGIKIGRAHV